MGRLNTNMSVDEVAEHLKLPFPANILDWENNEISTLRLALLRKLIRLYGLDEAVVFDLLFQLRLQRIETKLKRFLKGVR